MLCYRCLEIEAEDKDAASENKEEKVVDQAGVIQGVTGRHGMAHQFAKWLEANNLKPAAQCLVERDASKKYYRIGWSLGAGELGGEIHIYGPTWIRIQWDGDIEFAPMRGSRIFDSDFCAEQFMISAFIEKNWHHATLVPEKPPKGSK